MVCGNHELETVTCMHGSLINTHMSRIINKSILGYIKNKSINYLFYKMGIRVCIFKINYKIIAYLGNLWQR